MLRLSNHISLTDFAESGMTHVLQTATPMTCLNSKTCPVTYV